MQLDYFKNLKIIFTKPNFDINAKIIIKLIDKYVRNNPEKAVTFTSMGQQRYLSTIQFADAVVGNSSSGIIEVPAFGKSTVNIRSRQKGRIKAENIIDCKPRKKSIISALKKAFSPEFKKLCKKVKNPYGEGKAAEKIVKILKEKLNKIKDIKKTFYDFDIGI